VSLVEDLRPVVDAGRQLAQDLGLRGRSVTVRVRTWSGGRIGSGTASDVDTLLVPAPKVVEPPARLVGDAPGMYESGDLIVTKIARDTYTESTFTPSKIAGVEVIFLVDTRQYRIVGAPSDKNFEWALLLRRMDRPA